LSTEQLQHVVPHYCFTVYDWLYYYCLQEFHSGTESLENGMPDNTQGDT